VSAAPETPEGAVASSAPRAEGGGVLSDALSIARYHIVLVAMVASVVFGFVLVGKRSLLVAVLVGIDWFLINLVNRVTDIAEDLENGIPGTERVARRRTPLAAGSVALFASSIAISHALVPALTPWRVAVQAIGVAYNYRVLPVPRRAGVSLSRFKELYFFKNFASSVLFVLTCFAYPIVEAGAWHAVPKGALATLVVFFVAFELTYEILYDLRDLDGDRAEGVPTYPVVHGPLAARRIIDGLLALAATALVVGFVLRAVGVRELLMLVAPAAQLAFYRPRFARGLTTPDCVWLTHLGTIELLLFLGGTEVWRRAGLPDNVWFGG
jgi:4-hydroxybenzoate polyprenyltransferase